MGSERAVRPLDICVLFDAIGSPWGGANQFLNSLVSEFRRQGHRVTSIPTPGSQVVLLNAFLRGPGNYLHPWEIAQLRYKGEMNRLGRLIPSVAYRYRKRKGPVLIHRLDGVAELVRGRRTKADEVQPAVNRLTDHTIFQTEYCRTSFAEHCGIVPGSWRVIKNAVDPEVFFPNLERRRDRRTTSSRCGVLVFQPSQGFCHHSGGVTPTGSRVDLRGQLVSRRQSCKRETGWSHEVEGACRGHALFPCYDSRGLERALLQRDCGGDGVRPALDIPRFWGQPGTGRGVRSAAY